MKVVLCLLLAITAAYASPSERQLLCGPVCMIYCPYGNVMDSRGCPTCSCNSAPVQLKRQDPVCGPVCMMYCPFGNVLDSQGCPTCRCNWPSSQAPAVKRAKHCDNSHMALCDLWCPSGKIAHDNNGCPLCACDNNIAILP